MPSIGIMEKREPGRNGLDLAAGLPTERMPFYSVKFLQTLRANYSDQMAQFVFDVAGHGDGVSDLLAQ